MEEGIRDSHQQSGKLIRIKGKQSLRKSLDIWKRISLRIPIRWLNLMMIKAFKLAKVSLVVIKMRRGLTRGLRNRVILSEILICVRSFKSRVCNKKHNQIFATQKLESRVIHQENIAQYVVTFHDPAALGVDREYVSQNALEFIRRQNALTFRFNIDCSFSLHPYLYYINNLFKMMLASAANASSQYSDSIFQKIKQTVLKLTWKHAILLSIPVCLYIYPKPIIKLFMPIASKFSNNHPNVNCNETLQQIILTNNQQISLQSLSKIKIMKGTSPHLQNYGENEAITIQLFATNKKSNLFATFSTLQAQVTNEQTINLYSQTLWNNFRITKIENPQMKLLLIKASQPILMHFLLKFYKISKNQSHKIGFLTHNKIMILRLDRRVGTYEHLTCEFEQF